MRSPASFDSLSYSVDSDVFDMHSPQSGYEAMINPTGNTKSQNVKFSDQHDAYKIDIESNIDDTRKSQDTGDATLDNFFSRPIKIHEEEWTTSTALSAQIDPWSLYFTNPRVSNRIANFNLLRCKLHVKVVLNGNGFLYGRAIAAYLPHAQFDLLTNTSGLINENLVQLTQLPKVFLNPTNSTGGEMVLPFFIHHNYLEIPINEWDFMGDLIIRSISDLKHSNGAADQVTVSVFAWAEDVELSVLTSVEPTTLTPQSGVEETEEANKTGMISGPATRVAHIAGSLKSAPVIGPYASATSEMANATASLAKAFGYCRPTLTADPMPYKPTMASSLALTTLPDGVSKLSVDDKQELSIDPRIAGLGSSDPLDIRSIATRESYLTKFTWAIGTAPETLLWNARITPVTWAENGTPTAFYFPACAMAALPFRNWTGTMNFRFQVIASAFHKGRLKVVYDPNYLVTNEYNTNYLEVIDIADKTDFTISIANGQHVTYLDHHKPGIDSVTQLYSTTPYLSKEEGNGVVGIYVVNELTTPNSTVTNDVEIAVYVSMGDDFEVANPDDHFQRFVTKPQSGMETMTEVIDTNETTDELDRPEQVIDNYLGPSKDMLENINHVFYGETIRSFRPLLKRYALHECIGPLAGTYTVAHHRRCMLPYYRGNVSGAVHLANGGLSPYNFVNTLLIHWVVTAFQGWRGAMRYKILPRGPLDNDNITEVERYNTGPFDTYYVSTNSGIDFYTTTSDAARAAVLGDKNATPYIRQSLTGYNGLARVHRSVNPQIEFEIPFYANFRYHPGKINNYTDLPGNVAPLQSFVIRDMTNGETSTLKEIHVAVGEDFQCFFWTGLPPLYFENTPPPL